MNYTTKSKLDWKNILQKAVDANIVVYDYDAYQGHFGYNLIKLTENFMKVDYNQELKYVYTPIPNVEMYNVPGIELIRFDELGQNNIYGKYLCEDLDARRAHNNVEWAIGCNEEQNCWLLMSF